MREKRLSRKRSAHDARRSILGVPFIIHGLARINQQEGKSEKLE